MIRRKVRLSSKKSLQKALLGYRILAYATGIWLIALCFELVFKYIVQINNPPNWIAIVHGWIYFMYLLLTTNLAVKAKWSISKTLAVLVSGTIPVLGIVVEHYNVLDLKKRFDI